MKKVILAVLLASSFSYAQDSTADDAAELQKTYMLTCGTYSQAAEAADHAGEELSDSDKKELRDMRMPVLNVLRKGQQALQDIKDEGDKNDTGGFGLILTCGLIDQFSAQLKEKGCLDLETNEVVKDAAGGIALCQDLAKKLNK